MISIEEILKVAKLHPLRVSNIYLFGSRIYKTHTDDSDYDILIIAKNSVEAIEIKSDKFNIHIYTESKFREDLEWHLPRNLECLYSPDFARLKENIKFDLEINEAKIRHAISHVSSNSWVKAKKKLEIGEYNIGIKSLFHSLRIPMFGIQIMESGRIYDFECSNHIWEKLNSKKWTWDELYNEYKLEHNRILTDFRKLAKKKAS